MPNNYEIFNVENDEDGNEICRLEINETERI